VVATRLDEVVEILGGERPPPRPSENPPARATTPPGPDLGDVHGQPEARRALEIAAAGGHHSLLLGPPGCGKSMLARRLPSILPPLTQEQALEVAAIRSVAGRFAGVDPQPPLLDRVPPFRAPHHAASAAALLGGGTGVARPGEVSLAHHGVLFMDELLEWPRGVLLQIMGWSGNVWDHFS
jgi:magnesium chelatase family protein